MIAKCFASLLFFGVLGMTWLLYTQYEAPPKLSVMRRDMGPFWFLEPPSEAENKRLSPPLAASDTAPGQGLSGRIPPNLSSPPATASPSLIEPPHDLASRAAQARASILQPRPIIDYIVSRLDDAALQGVVVVEVPPPPPPPAKSAKSAALPKPTQQKQQPAPSDKNKGKRITSLSVESIPDGAIIRCLTAAIPERMELLTLASPPKAIIDFGAAQPPMQGYVAVPDNPVVSSVDVRMEDGITRVTAILKSDRILAVPSLSSDPAAGYSVSINLDPNAPAPSR